jgi:hypothetical protein
MIINITKSTIFSLDPSIRFSKEYGLPKEVWIEIWRRYKLLDYSNGDIRDYLFLKYARNISWSAMNRWLARGEIYMITEPLITKGVVHVNSAIFKDYEEYVMNELVRPLKDGASNKPKSII